MPFEDAFALTVLVLAAIVLSIVALAKLAGLKSSVDELRRRITNLEGQRETSTAPTVAKPAVPPPLPAYVTAAAVPKSTTPTPVATTQHAAPTAFNWESLLGVKLFAWIGSLALFLGVVFFVKYAFENNWITPTMRIVSGALIGVALVIVGLLPSVRRYRVPAQSVCGTAILILSADIYAAYAFYNLIPLTAATSLMWIVTGGALLLANNLEAQSAAWLALIGGFLTPVLMRGVRPPPQGAVPPQFGEMIFVITYIVILDCAVAFISSAKQWRLLLSAAALGSVILALGWMEGVFFDPYPYLRQHVFLLVIEATFLALCTIVAWKRSLDYPTIVAMAIAGLGVLIGLPFGGRSTMNPIDPSPSMFLGAGGIIAFVTAHRRFVEKGRAMATLVGLALALTFLFEWSWCRDILRYRHTPSGSFLDGHPAAMTAAVELWRVVFWNVAVFLLFAATPFLIGTNRIWPWVIAAISGPPQFWFVYSYLNSPPSPLVNHQFLWLVPLAFALPAAISVLYLVKKEHVDLASGDSRLATQGSAVLAFVSLIFPVQFHHEWITLGWAIEGLALVLLFRWIPNRRLRAVSLIALCAAFVRLAINPAVLTYHPRTHIPIWNWYFYAYGVSAICFFLAARWFGEPREKTYERVGRPLLYSLAGIVVFLLMNIQIADFFSIGPTLTFSFEGNFARDMTYTIAWSLFAFALLVLGIVRNARAVRLVAIALLCAAFAKLFLHDLDSLSQLYRIAAFIAVAIIAIVASFVYQRFLSPATTKT